MKQNQNNETRIKVQYAAKLLCKAMKTLKLSTPEMLCDIFDISSKYRIDIVDYIDLMQRRENALNNLFSLYDIFGPDRETIYNILEKEPLPVDFYKIQAHLVMLASNQLGLSINDSCTLFHISGFQKEILYSFIKESMTDFHNNLNLLYKSYGLNTEERDAVSKILIKVGSKLPDCETVSTPESTQRKLDASQEVSESLSALLIKVTEIMQ